MAEKYSTESKREKVKEITEQLEAGLKALFKSDNYRQYLDTLSKFHNYSFNNTMLIALQNPDATLVAGFRSWQTNFERHVNKGEKGIKILAPNPYTIKQPREKIDDKTGLTVLDRSGKPVMEEVEITIPDFKVVSVFDVSQTSGKKLPTVVNDLKGDIEDFDKFFSVLKEVSPVPIKFEDITSGSHGFFSRETEDITIKSGMSQTQTIKTTIHEITHAMLHGNINDIADKNRETREVEAESVAYTVCRHFGLDTSDYSFGYIATWGSGAELPELKASLETIRETASKIISSIEDKFLARDKEQQLERNIDSGEHPRESSNVIGNTPYKFIQDKQYVKVPSGSTSAVEEYLQGSNIPYSGLKGKTATTFTVSKENLDALRGFVEDMKLANTEISKRKDKETPAKQRAASDSDRKPSVLKAIEEIKKNSLENTPRQAIEKGAVSNEQSFR